MKKYAFFATVLLLESLALALDGTVNIHDPSTIAVCNGKFYTYGTGGNALVSDDGWTWRRGTNLPRRGLAPDVIHIGDRYYVYVAANIGGQPRAAINMIWSKSLDPESPEAWSSYAHALARTDRLSECCGACRRALELGEDPEVADLLERVEAAQPRRLSERTAA